MKLNVGDYVRTKYGRIGKISNLTVDYSSELILCEESSIPFAKHQIIKSSPNIIDLIEENDYIRIITDTDFRRIYNSYGKLVIYRGEELPIETFSNKFIGGIITHEQFEAMKYVVGDTNVKDKR